MTSDQQERATAEITTPTEREIRIERVFDAPRDRVFAVYTDPELIPSGGGREAPPPTPTTWTSEPAGGGAL